MKPASTLLAAGAVLWGLGCGTGPSSVGRLDARSSLRCAALVDEYAAALPAAKACRGGETCSESRPEAFLDQAVEGIGCWTLVSDAGAPVLDEILGKFDAAGCQVLPLPCPAPPPPAACTRESVCP
jgi:hypothetical protein